jgi:hypothetical protein
MPVTATKKKKEHSAEECPITIIPVRDALEILNGKG